MGSSSITIRNVAEDDFVKLAEFLSEGFKEKTPEIWKNRFRMWWENNPVFNTALHRGWILESNKSKIVGFMGNIPVKFLINGKKGLAAAASSWYVGPGVKGVNSVLPLLKFIKQKEFNLFLSTSPGDNVQKMNLQTGFSRVKLPFNAKEYWYIINYKKITDIFIKRKIKFKKIIPLIIKLSSSFMPILSFSQISEKKQQAKLEENELICSICTYCENSFTKLWEENIKEKTTTLYRDAETLNWLYFSDSVREKRHVIKCEKKHDNKLLGYMVFDTIQKGKDLILMRLRDVYIPICDEKIALILVSYTIKLAKKLNADAIKFWAINNHMAQVFKKNLITRRDCKYQYLYKFNKHDESTIKKNKNHEFIPSVIDPDRGIL